MFFLYRLQQTYVNLINPSSSKLSLILITSISSRSCCIWLKQWYCLWSECTVRKRKNRVWYDCNYCISAYRHDSKDSLDFQCCFVTSYWTWQTLPPLRRRLPTFNPGTYVFQWTSRQISLHACFHSFITSDIRSKLCWSVFFLSSEGLRGYDRGWHLL